MGQYGDYESGQDLGIANQGKRRLQIGADLGVSNRGKKITNWGRD